VLLIRTLLSTVAHRRFSPRFAFTLLDPNNPDRRFEFSLAVVGTVDEKDSNRLRRWNEASSYELVSHDRLLARRESELGNLLRDLNETDDMNAFTLGMRRLFESSLLEDQQ
jgi:hypothetical protein